MTDAIRWLSDNKTWFFDGLGGLILVGVAGWVLKTFLARGQGDTTQTQRAQAGPGASVIQAGGDVNVNTRPEPHPRTVRVLAHRATHLGNGIEHYFIKIINTTPDAYVEVTHVWFQNDQRVDLLDPQLPSRIRPNETWETYIPVANIPQDADALRHFHAVLSTLERFTSEPNTDVAPIGRIARR